MGRVTCVLSPSTLCRNPGRELSERSSTPLCTKPQPSETTRRTLHRRDEVPALRRRRLDVGVRSSSSVRVQQKRENRAREENTHMEKTYLCIDSDN